MAKKHIQEENEKYIAAQWVQLIPRGHFKAIVKKSGRKMQLHDDCTIKKENNLLKLTLKSKKSE